MCNFDEVIAKSIELNNAINKLNNETKVLNSIVKEKRNETEKDIIETMRKYVDVMTTLDIKAISFKTNSFMYYNTMSRRLGIRIRRWDNGTQIDLGCCSTVNSDFYTFHSIGYVCAGLKKYDVRDSFYEKWDDIKNNIDTFFFAEVEKILNDRKEKAIAERENAIKNLTAISR